MRLLRLTFKVLLLLCSVFSLVSFAAPANNPKTPPAIRWTTAADDEFSRPLLKDAWRDEVLKAVNWDCPGLEEAKKLYLSGDKQAASAAFVKYLRTRKRPRFFTDRLKSFDTKRAGEGVNYIWRYGANSHQFPNQKIDWFYNKTREIPGMEDYEWQWQLNRMPWFVAMAGAYQHTKDPRYAIAFVRQLRSWAASCGVAPEGFANRRYSAWRGIESGLRLANFWAPAFYGFLDAKEFTDDDVMLYCYLGLIQSRHLKKFNTSGNIYAMEMNGIYTFGAMFPEFKESAEARKYAISGLYNRVKTMFLPDGFLNELTNSYHSGVVGDMIHIFRLANDCGLGKELPGDFIKLLERSYDAQVHMMTPGFDMPLTNDSRHTKLWERFAPAVEYFPHRQDFLWVRSNRKAGKQPDFLSTVMPWAGFVMLRESWDKDASYLCFDIGPLGKRHQHQDKLNITIWKGEDMLLYDDGGGSYARSKIRHYTRSSLAHNLISVDGMVQATDSDGDRYRVLTSPVTGELKSDGKTDYTRAVFDKGWNKSGNKIVLHDRQIVYLRPNIFIVLDRMIPTKRGINKPHSYQARWHVDTLKLRPALPGGHPSFVTSPESSITSRERGRKKRNKLIVAPLFTEGVAVGSASGKLSGNWNELSGIYAVHPYRVTTTITHSRAAAKGEQRFLTLFMTLGNREKSPLAKIIQHGNDGATVEFTDGSRLQISITNGKLSAKKVK